MTELILFGLAAAFVAGVWLGYVAMTCAERSCPVHGEQEEA